MLFFFLIRCVYQAVATYTFRKACLYASLLCTTHCEYFNCLQAHHPYVLFCLCIICIVSLVRVVVNVSTFLLDHKFLSLFLFYSISRSLTHRSLALFIFFFFVVWSFENYVRFFSLFSKRLLFVSSNTHIYTPHCTDSIFAEEREREREQNTIIQKILQHRFDAMKAIMKIIARTYKINEEYLNKLEMPLRLVFWMGATCITSIYLFIESLREYRFFFICSLSLLLTPLCLSKFAINCSSIKRNGDTNAKFHHSSSLSSSSTTFCFQCILLTFFFCFPLKLQRICAKRFELF